MQLNKNIAYRTYNFNESTSTIIYNTLNTSFIFLDELSSELFKLLMQNDKCSTVNFLKVNDISEDEYQEFIDDLKLLNIIENGDICYKGNKNPYQNIDNNKMLIEYIKKLYNNGYIYSMHIDLTNRCNEKCIHCYHPFDTYDYSTELNTKQIKKIIDTAYDLGVFEITLSGGEIFLRNDIFEI